jgi:MFS family permease
MDSPQSPADTVGRFAALANHNFRRWIVGLWLSVSGSWMASIAVAWLVLDLGGSGTALGVLAACQCLPILFFGTWTGVLVDRLDKRTVLIGAQLGYVATATVLGLLVTADVAEIWMVALVSGAMGAITAFEHPARYTFVGEMVEPAGLKNAVTLNNVVMNFARIGGPAVGGTLVATVGLAPCFFANAASSVVFIVALVGMRTAELHPATPQPRERGQLRAGLHYVATNAHLRIPLVMAVIIGMLTWEFNVTLPLLANFTFDGNAGAYAALLAAMGVGAVTGGIFQAGKTRAPLQRLPVYAVVFGVGILAVSIAPSLELAVLGMLFVGAASISFVSSTNTSIQLDSDPAMRGRVMSIWSIGFLGTTPIGGPIVGWIGEHVDARAGVATSGAAAVVAGIYGMWEVVLLRRRTTIPTPAVDPASEPAAAH